MHTTNELRIARKTGGSEKEQLDHTDLEFHRREFERLRASLQQAFEQSDLPEMPKESAALNNVLVRIQLNARR